MLSISQLVSLNFAVPFSLCYLCEINKLCLLKPQTNGKKEVFDAEEEDGKTSLTTAIKSALGKMIYVLLADNIDYTT